jgi:hypothetical protein
MRQKGLAVIGVVALMTLGVSTAEAGITCKIIPSWCPSDNSGGPGEKYARGGGNNPFPSHNNGGGNNNNGGGNNGGGNTGGGAGGNTGGGSNGGGYGNSGQNPGGNQNPGGGTYGGGTPGGNGSSTPTSVPEPASLMLLGAGVSAVGAAVLRRRKNNKKD